MHHHALLTLTRALVIVVGSLGILAAVVHDGGTEPVVVASAADAETRSVVELPARNILDPDLSHAAIGCSADQHGQLWATVNFWG